jgi:hypothetical protein
MEKFLEWLGERTAIYKGDTPIPNIVVVGGVIFTFILIVMYFKKK